MSPLTATASVPVLLFHGRQSLHSVSGQILFSEPLIGLDPQNRFPFSNRLLSLLICHHQTFSLRPVCGIPYRVTPSHVHCRVQVCSSVPFFASNWITGWLG